MFYFIRHKIFLPNVLYQTLYQKSYRSEGLVERKNINFIPSVVPDKDFCFLLGLLKIRKFQFLVLWQKRNVPHVHVWFSRASKETRKPPLLEMCCEDFKWDEKNFMSKLCYHLFFFVFKLFSQIWWHLSEKFLLNGNISKIWPQQENVSCFNSKRRGFDFLAKKKADNFWPSSDFFLPKLFENLIFCLAFLFFVLKLLLLCLSDLTFCCATHTHDTWILV